MNQVQRGTIHGWKNKSNSWGRIYFILLAAEPLTVDGQQLGDAGCKLLLIESV